MQGMGAEVLFHGVNYDEAKLYCEQLSQEHGYRYIHSGNEPLLIAGVATGILEMMEDEPGIEVNLCRHWWWKWRGRCVHCC